MRPELLQWAAHSASIGMDFGLVTNGRMLAYEDLLEKLIKHRLKYVYMSLHGGTPKIHNLMVRADAFEQTYQAVKNLSGRGLDFTVNTVVTRQNLNHLKPMVDAILPYPDVVLKFSMVQPKGGGEKLFDHLMPRVEDVARKVHEAITYGVKKVGANAGPRFAHDGIPLCLLPSLAELYDDLRTHGFAAMIEGGEPDFFPVDDKAKTQPPEQCGACTLRGPCPGLFAGYHEVFGAAELRPVHDRPRSNSFNYTFEGFSGKVVDDKCPLFDDGTTPWDRGRHMFVRRADGTLARFRATSRDFADTEIEHVKHDLGQVYVDVSGKGAPDDFARDLVHLRRSKMCDGCPAFAHCTGVHEMVTENVFARDDARVRELIASLSGDVLDVGCGEGPYGDLFAPLATGESPRVKYTGVEPDAKHAEGLRARWPWARVLTATAESLSTELQGDERFDHVLVLRSWNHLREPHRALTSIVKWLRPGGTLTVVDNVAFGLVRTRAQTQRAEAGPAMFEHYRNDTSHEARAVLDRLGLVLIEQRDVSPTSSNQWLLRYRLGGDNSVTSPVVETVSA